MDRIRLRTSLFGIFASLVLTALAVVACGSNTVREAFEPNDVGDETPTPTPTKDAGTDSAKPTGKSPDEAAVPEVTAVTPSTATVGSVGPTVIVSGKSFVERSIVQLDGAPLATSFVSESELRATIPTNELTAVGTLRLSVGTAPPGGGASKDIPFEVVNPKPQVTALSPISVLAGSVATSLDVTGDGFVSGAKIVFGTTDLTTSFVDKTHLTATIPAARLVTSATVPVTVVNPTPGGGASTALSFTVSNPSASITSVSPSSAPVGAEALELTVDGSGFVSTSVVLFNGTALTTTFSGATKLTAQLPAASLTTAGDFPISVQNAPPGGGVSAPVVFKVQYPAPTATAVTPSSVAIGAPSTVITVTGTGFSGTTQITFDDAPVATTLVDATHVSATVDAAHLVAAGSHQVRVVNPSPGGGTSAAVAFTVSSSAPTITSLTPPSVTVGAPDTLITIIGTGFNASSVVKANGLAITSSFVSATQLTATVPSTQLTTPGALAISVYTPPPGGGTSAAANLSIACDTTGVQYPLGAIGTLTTISLTLDSTGLMPVWNAAGKCTVVTLDSNTADNQPGRYFVVQNTAGQTVTLSAWADCTTVTTGDAFLTFYKRPTVPANDTERLGCANVVSEGTNGPGGYASPESGGSLWCPGLTKANGGGLSLAACEKAVVHIQPYDYTGQVSAPPKKLKLKPEAP